MSGLILKSGGPFSNELRLISIDSIVNNLSIGSEEKFVVLTNNLLTKLKTACSNKTFSHRILIQNYNVDAKPIKRKIIFFYIIRFTLFFPVEQSGNTSSSLVIETFRKLSIMFLIRSDA